MDSAHLHIVLNHAPVVGTIMVMFILFYGIIRKNEEIKKLALIISVLVALVTIPVYTSGDGAQQIVEGMEGVDEDKIDAHEDFAQYSFIAMEVFGGIALLGLLMFRAPKTLPLWFVLISFIFLLVITGMMGWTANLGGQIHHPEVHGIF
jgi:hypothetical protein